MPSESGDMKLLGNFSKLIELIPTDPNYSSHVAAAISHGAGAFPHDAGAISHGALAIFHERSSEYVNDKEINL